MTKIQDQTLQSNSRPISIILKLLKNINHINDQVNHHQSKQNQQESALGPNPIHHRCHPHWILSLLQKGPVAIDLQKVQRPSGTSRHLRPENQIRWQHLQRLRTHLRIQGLSEEIRTKAQTHQAGSHREGQDHHHQKDQERPQEQDQEAQRKGQDRCPQGTIQKEIIMILNINEFIHNGLLD